MPWKALVPLRTISLNWPPVEWPNSGENWFCWTVNSATASFGIVTSGPVTLPLLLSMPSTMKLLSRGRCPATDGPVPTPTPPLVVTPAFRSERLRTPEPVEAEGKSITSLVSKEFETWAVVVSTAGAAAETSTVSVLAPTCSVTFAVPTRFNSTLTSFTLTALKPEAVTVRV